MSEGLVLLRSPFNGGTIAVPADSPVLAVFLDAGFLRVDAEKPAASSTSKSRKEFVSHGH